MAWHIGQKLHRAYLVCAVVAPGYLPWQVTGTSGNEPNGEGGTRNGDTHYINLFRSALQKSRAGCGA